MKKQLILAIALVAGLSLASANHDPTITPTNPDVIVLDSPDWEEDKTFELAGNEGDAQSAVWTHDDTTDTIEGPSATFTFDRESSNSVTVEVEVPSEDGSHLAGDTISETPQTVEDVPNITLTASSEEVDTGEDVTFTVEETNQFDGPLNYSWSESEAGQDEESFTKAFDSTGDKTVEVQATDNVGLSSDKKSVTVTIDSGGGDSGPSGGGGGGGFGGAPPQQENDTDEVENNTNQTEISPKDGASSVVAEPGNGVAKVNFTKKEGVKDISIQVDPTSEKSGVRNIRITSDRSGEVSVSVRNMGAKKPEKVPEAAEEVYNYQEINTSINDSEVDVAEIDFSVNRSWIDGRNYSVEDVVIKRFDSGSWGSLPTRHLNSTQEVHNFESRSEGFSYYSVALEDRESQQTNETQTEDTENKDTTGNNFYIIALVALAAATGLFYLWNREGEKAEPPEGK